MCFGVFLRYNLYMETKMMISEMNGNYWDEIFSSCYALNGVDMVYNETFYDFVYMYCGV